MLDSVLLATVPASYRHDPNQTFFFISKFADNRSPFSSVMKASNGCSYFSISLKNLNRSKTTFLRGVQ